MKNTTKKYHYLYKTINLINEKYYYGIHSTNNLDDNYLGSGKYLRNAIHRHGKDNFKREIIKMFESREELVKAEIDLLTREILEDKKCMNINFGGDAGKLGMVTVKDKDGKTFSVFCDDSRYLSGELVHNLTGFVNVIDENGFVLHIDKNDPRYLSGELKHFNCNKMTVKDKNGKYFYIDDKDERYLSGEFVGITKNKITIKDKEGKNYNVDINDPRYLSGELVCIWKDKKHTEETKIKISEKAKERIGNKNSQFGTCWITKDCENKKIKKEELNQYLNEGWFKGRKIKVL